MNRRKYGVYLSLTSRRYDDTDTYGKERILSFIHKEKRGSQLYSIYEEDEEKESV